MSRETHQPILHFTSQFKLSVWNSQKLFIAMVILYLGRLMSTLNKDHDYMFKVILLGQSGVGKSNILLRCTKDQFSLSSQPTLGVEYATRLITTATGTRVKLQIWDTAGQEKYKSLIRTFYKGASAAIIVYDITRQASFQNIQKEINAMKDFTKTDIVSMIVGNKADLQQQRVVSKEKAMGWAQSKRIAAYQTSAKTGYNVQLIFQKLAEELQMAMTPSKMELSQERSKPSKSSIVICQTNYDPAKKQCCR